MRPRDVHICETGPRDGLQNLHTFVPTAAKCALIDAIAASGVPEIDAGSFVPPKVVPHFAADEIGLADTLGCATPPLTKSIVAAVSAEVGAAIPLRLHLHDTLGLGLANVVAGLEVGIRLFDAAVSGLGGCPFAPGARGNIVSEHLIFMLEDMGLKTGIDLERLMTTRAILAQHVPAELLTGHLHRAGIPKALTRVA